MIDRWSFWVDLDSIGDKETLKIFLETPSRSSIIFEFKETTPVEFYDKCFMISLSATEDAWTWFLDPMLVQIIQKLNSINNLRPDTLVSTLLRLNFEDTTQDVFPRKEYICKKCGRRKTIKQLLKEAAK